MADYHVHIGQFENVYYYADRVFRSLAATLTDEVWFSSTTSCLYCKESPAAKANPSVAEHAPTARELYKAVLEEMEQALYAAMDFGIEAHPLYWGVPDVHIAAGVCVESAMAQKDRNGKPLYEGFKIHPRAQKWDLSDGRTASLAQEVFSYADSHRLRIVIHCGEDAMENPRLFEPLIARYSAAIVQLAHSRPFADTLYMLRAYSNTVCDTAMASQDTLMRFIEAGIPEERVLYGTDFPINHYHKKHPEADPSAEELLGFIFEERNYPSF